MILDIIEYMYIDNYITPDESCMCASRDRGILGMNAIILRRVDILNTIWYSPCEKLLLCQGLFNLQVDLDYVGSILPHVTSCSHL